MSDIRKPSLLDSIRAKNAATPPAAPAKVDEPRKPVFPNLQRNKPAIQAAVAEQPKPVASPALAALAATKPSPTPPAAPKPNLLAAAAAKGVEKKQAMDQDYSYLHAELPTDIKELCQRFDDMIVRDGGIGLINIDLGRAYVKKIMVMLKENPEFDGMIIDRDVHNVMAFVRKTREAAIDTINVKVEKATKAAKNKAAKTGRFGSIEAIDFGATGPAVSLEDLRDVEF
jgi:hypothetical protein